MNSDLDDGLDEILSNFPTEDDDGGEDSADGLLEMLMDQEKEASPPPMKKRKSEIENNSKMDEMDADSDSITTKFFFNIESLHLGLWKQHKDVTH